MARARSHAVCSKMTGRTPSKWTSYKAIFTGRLIATEKLNQLARESFVIRAVALCGLAVRFHFASEIAQGGPSLRAMLAVFVPIIRPQSKKDADSYEDNFKEQVENERCPP